MLGVDRLYALDAVGSELRGAGGLDVVGVALRDDAAGGDERDGRVLHVGDGRRGLDAVEARHRIFGLERLALELLDEHVYRALRADLFLEVVDADAALDVAGLFGRTRLSVGLKDFEDEFRHGGDGFAHAARAVGGRYDEDRLLVHVDARVLGVHAGDGGDSELLLHRVGYAAGSGSVTSGVEGRAGDYRVGLESGDELEDFLVGLIHVLGIVAVAADDRSDYFGRVAEGRLKGCAGSDYAFAGFGLNFARHFLSADAGVELVDVVYYSFLGHCLSPPTRSWR